MAFKYPHGAGVFVVISMEFPFLLVTSRRVGEYAMNVFHKWTLRYDLSCPQARGRECRDVLCALGCMINKCSHHMQSSLLNATPAILGDKICSLWRALRARRRVS